MDEVKIWEEEVSIPTYEVGEPDVNPMFLEKRVYQGSSGKIYPYPATSTISREKKDKKTEETVKHVQEYITEEMKKRMLEGSVSVYKEPEQFIKHIGRLVDAKPAADLKSFIHSTIM